MPDGGHVEWSHGRSKDYRFVVKQYVGFALKRLFIFDDRNKPGFSNRICKINSIKVNMKFSKLYLAGKLKL